MHILLRRFGAYTLGLGALTACGAILGIDELPEPGDAGPDSASGATGGSGGTGGAGGTGGSVDASSGGSAGSAATGGTAGASAAGGASGVGGAGGTAGSGGSAGAAGCGSVPVGAAGTTTYSAFTESQNWQFAENVLPAWGGIVNATSGVFDGRYVYYPSRSLSGDTSQDGTVARYDTCEAFTASSGWTKYDLDASVDPDARSFLGGAFDGKYVYLFTFGNSTKAIALRYDPTTPFAQTSSWDKVDLGALEPKLSLVAGVVFDGKYLYTVPGNECGDAADESPVARFDTTSATFDNSASWSFFNLPVKLGATIKGYAGGTFDGTYVYFPPIRYGCSTPHGTALRYDTTKAFDQSASWQTYDLKANVSGFAEYFAGAVFAGGYVYFVPYTSGHFIRFDTSKSFTDSTAWQSFPATDLDAAAQGYQGGTFDGRYVHFSPRTAAAIALRYDTTLPFVDTTSWQMLNVKTNPTTATQELGSPLFDGEYVYFVPSNWTRPIRFHAKSPAWLPAGWNASFY